MFSALERRTDSMAKRSVAVGPVSPDLVIDCEILCTLSSPFATQDDFFSWIRHNSHTPGVSAPLRGSTVWQAAVPETDDEKYLSCGDECCPNLHSMRLAHFVSEWERVQPTTKGAKMSHVEKLHRMKTMRSKQASYVRASHLCFCGAENSPLPLQRLESLKVCIPHPLSCCWRSPDAADRMNEFTQVFTYDNCMYRTHRV